MVKFSVKMLHVLFNPLHISLSMCITVAPHKLDMCSEVPGTFDLLTTLSYTVPTYSVLTIFLPLTSLT